MKKYYMVGNTHFDPVWLWRWDEAMASIRATFRSALERMKETPDFIYSFATPPVFEWIRETDPDMFEEIRARVREGRWELAEGWWVQPDCYSASGESYVRQGLYGQRYLKKNFGKCAKVMFQIDSFGHSPMLPQILKKSGIDYYCFVRPESRHLTLAHPLFRWQSADGSEVMAYRAELAYEKDWHTSVAAHTDTEDALIVYGVTDHGGAPTKKALAEIASDEQALFSSVEGYFLSHDTDYLVRGELLTGDFGPYANYARIKRLNRTAEYAVLNAERASLIAGKDIRAKTEAAWRDILFNQFHDILGGASIKDAYIDAENMLGRAMASANEEMHFALQSLTRRIKTPGENPDTAWNVVLWNLNGASYEGYVETEVQWAHEFDWYDKGIALADAEGSLYPCAVIREKSVIPRFRSRFIFKAAVPSMGYRAFRVVQTGEEVKKKAIDPYEIQTDRLAVRFSRENGCLSLVTDKKSGMMHATRLLVPVAYEDKGDTWCFNITSYEKTPEYFNIESLNVIEANDLLTELKATYRLRNNTVEMYYRFYRDAAYFDVRYRVNWDERHRVLKLVTDVKSMTHTAAVPAGEVTRTENPADVPLGAWVRADGIGIAANGAFAYSMNEGTLGITLLRSPIYGDLRISEIDDTLDYDIIDRGITEGGLRVFFEGDPWQTAEAFCNPPVAVIESNHEGDLLAEDSFLRIEEAGVAVYAFKRREEGEGSVLRLCETLGSHHDFSFTAMGLPYRTTLSPYEIKTLCLLDGRAEEISMTENTVEDMP